MAQVNLCGLTEVHIQFCSEEGIPGLKSRSDGWIHSNHILCGYRPNGSDSRRGYDSLQAEMGDKRNSLPGGKSVSMSTILFLEALME